MPKPLQRMRLLNTRPEPQASRFAADLRAVFGDRLEVIASPLMQPEFLPLTLPERDFAALVLTSETGAEAAARLKAAGAPLPPLAFCVGDRTAEVALSAVTETVSAKGDAGDLVDLLKSRPEDPLLYLHGEDRAADLAAALAPDLRSVTSLTAYRQRACGLSAEGRDLLASGAPFLLPLFSPRSARLFLEAAQGLVPDAVTPITISENARLILPHDLARRAVMAERPDGPSMMQAIDRCFQQCSP